jgi:hypothetical protein
VAAELAAAANELPWTRDIARTVSPWQLGPASTGVDVGSPALGSVPRLGGSCLLFRRKVGADVLCCASPGREYPVRDWTNRPL